MAVPMVTLTVLTLLVPFLLQSLAVLPDWEYLNREAVLLLVSSGLLGCVVGGVVYLNRTWSRPLLIPLRFVQDLLSYDFYIDRLYNVSVVFAVDRLSRFNAWLDRYVFDGLVNLVGLATIFSGQSLKYSISGQSQVYLFTILLGVSVLGLLVLWPLLSVLSFE
jgi:NAD(P)H-quinone oxidoreductase subunit 5